MKCTKCGDRAVINMPHHHMGLCKGHFLEWIPAQTERFIQKYEMFTKQDKILVAISGGKDSLSLWEILSQLGYQADGLYIDLGVDGGVHYSRESKLYATRFAENQKHKLLIVDIHEVTGKTIPEWSEMSLRGKGRTCSVCGLVKRHEMNRIAQEQGYDILATGHNLDDEAAVLMGNTLNWSVDYLLRQGPVLPAGEGMTKKVKPLFRFYEREMTAYALLLGIEYIYDECPYSENATSIQYKEILNQIENVHPGVKHAFYLKFLEAKSSGLFSGMADIHPDLHPCESCGQPTSAPGWCSFCRMVQKHTVDDFFGLAGKTGIND